MKVYIGILLLMGYASFKSIRMFWELKKDTHNELVSSAMRRNRFFEIHKYLHTCDNTKLFDDKFAKVFLYFSLLNESFKNNFINDKSFKYAIDEPKIPYYGKHGAKQHIHGKPIEFEYKIWSLCTSTEYLV